LEFSYNHNIMADYTIEQKAYLVSWAITFDNREESRRKFRDKYDAEPPAANVIRYWCLKFLETGNLVKHKERSGRPLEASSPENKENVVRHALDTPTTSQRSISQATGVSQASVSRILKKENVHAFKPLYCQKLYDGDEDRRLQFCETMIRLSNQDPALVRKIVFSDECHFELTGSVNKHNIHYYARVNPHHIIEKPVKTQSVTVWAAINYYGLVSHDVSQQTMTGYRYCQILNDKVIPIMTRQNHTTWYYQQDGAPPHYTLRAREILATNLFGRWIGRRGPIEWPARSPDFTPLDFWFWSYLQQKVYDPPGFLFPNTQALQQKIDIEINKIPLEMYRKSMNNFLVRVNSCFTQMVDILRYNCT
jgi:hypothetical protein